MSPTQRDSRTVRGGLRVRLAVGVAAILSVIAIGLVSFLHAQHASATRRSMETNAEHLAHTLAVAVGPSVEFDDQSGAEELLRSVNSLPNALVARATMKDGSAFAVWQRTDEVPSDLVYEASAEITISTGETVGAVSILTSTRAMEEELSHSLFLAMVGSLVAVVVGIVLSLLFGAYLAAPVRRLLRTVQQIIATRDLTIEVDAGGRDEIGVLADSFRQMVRNQADIIRGQQRAAAAFQQIVGRITATGTVVTQGAERVNDTIASAERAGDQLQTSLATLNKSVDVLHTSAHAGASSVTEMERTNEALADTARTMASSAHTTLSNVEHLARSIQEIANNISQLESAIEDASSSVIEVDATVKEVERGSRSTEELAGQAATDAQAGAQAVQNTVASIHEMQQMAERASKNIETLGERISEIGQILDVINAVAAQTNLLALNASIIAAQAGEHGRGFAVVANEIKVLADRTQSSTTQIADLIESVQEESRVAVDSVRAGARSIEQGMAVARQADESFHKILTSAQQSNEMVRAIARSTAEQARGTQKVTELVQRIAGHAREINQASTEQAAGAAQINSATRDMRQLTDGVLRQTETQEQSSRDVIAATQEIVSTVTDVRKAQSQQRASSEAVVGSVGTVGDVFVQQRLAVQDLETAMASLRQQAEELDRAMAEFRV